MAVLPAYSGEIYKWRDKNGILHYTDSPPPSDIHPPLKSKRLSDEKTPHDLPDLRPVKTGLLWKIKSPRGKISHVLGTIHSEDPRVLNLSPTIRTTFDQSESFAMEIVINGSVMLKMSTSMIILDGSDLKTMLGNELYAKVIEAAKIRGIPQIAIQRMKPWAVMMVLSVPQPKTGNFLDLMLYKEAVRQEKRVYGLETIDEQLGVFESLSLEDQIILLQETVNSIDKIPEIFEEMTLAYLAGDLRKIKVIAEASMADGNEEITKKFLKKLNDNRNLRMADRLEPYLHEGKIFVAVGALHLPGHSGIINLLRQRGYAAKAVQLQ